MLAIDHHERGHVCRGVHLVVITELRAPQPLVPVVLVVRAPDLQVHLKLLVVALGLTVDLRVISHGQVTLDTFELLQCLEELGDKLGSTVNNEEVGHAKVGVCIVMK
jgi:hypothetical protein